jgi:hypothetical protein
LSRLDPIRNRTFDVVILGCDPAAATAARDAALRGFATALVEYGDYGEGPRDTGLMPRGLAAIAAHGAAGMRAESDECDTLSRVAPHLVKPVELLALLRGLSLYREWKTRAVTGLFARQSRRVLTRDELGALEPQLALEGTEGGLAWQCARVDTPERLTVENILDAQAHGAVTLNYAGTIVERDNIRVRDRVSGEVAEVRARAFIAAPSADHTPFHCALPPLSGRAMVALARDGRRLLDLVPAGGVTLAAHHAGTLPQLREALSRRVRTPAPVLWTSLEIDGPHVSLAPKEAIAIEPGPLATHRLRAQRAVDRAARQLRSKAPCLTAGRTLERRAPDGAGETALAEQCVHLADYMRRRTALALAEDQGLSQAPRIAREIGAALGWSEARIEGELIGYQQWVVRSREPMRRPA